MYSVWINSSSSYLARSISQYPFLLSTSSPMLSFSRECSAIALIDSAMFRLLRRQAISSLWPPVAASCFCCRLGSDCNKVPVSARYCTCTSRKFCGAVRNWNGQWTYALWPHHKKDTNVFFRRDQRLIDVRPPHTQLTYYTCLLTPK